MKIKYRVENSIIEFELNEREAEEFSISLSVEKEDLQNEINEKFNKPEYNNWHKETRHITDLKPIAGDEEEIYGMDETLMKHSDKRLFTKDLDRFEEEEENKFLRKKLKRFLTDKEVDVIMAKDVDGISLIEYAQMINESKDAVTKRHKRAKDKLKKISKDVLFG